MANVAGDEKPVTPGAESEAVIDHATCLACHGDPSADRFVDPVKFSASVHGRQLCASCHTDITSIPHDTPLTAARWQAIPQTCGQCHGDIQAAYLRGIHGQAVAAGRREAPVCTDCHGEHVIVPVKQADSRVFPSRIPETCGQCHAAERIITRYGLPAKVVETYMESFHGLAHQFGSTTVANCASCHGAHEILPPTDPRSSVNKANLPKTCGQCHPGISPRIAAGSIHGLPAPGVWDPVRWVRWFYLVLIALVIGGMAVHNLLDFRRKLMRHHEASRQAGLIERMTMNERIQHGLLIIAFISLAYTGFALKFPQAWWASPFIGRFDWRGFGHRLAAWLFILLAAYHVGFMWFTRRGRKELRALTIHWQDLRDAWHMLLFNLGRRRERPPLARFSYVEKLKYWALVWGSLVMTITGGLLVGRAVTFRWLPKWTIDVITAIHYYEAILACLAILVWHFYFVIFDPEEYPMKWTWLTGQASRADQMHRTEVEEPRDDDADASQG